MNGFWQQNIASGEENRSFTYIPECRAVTYLYVLRGYKTVQNMYVVISI